MSKKLINYKRLIIISPEKIENYYIFTDSVQNITSLINKKPVQEYVFHCINSYFWSKNRASRINEAWDEPALIWFELKSQVIGYEPMKKYLSEFGGLHNQLSSAAFNCHIRSKLESKPSQEWNKVNGLKLIETFICQLMNEETKNGFRIFKYPFIARSIIIFGWLYIIMQLKNKNKHIFIGLPKNCQAVSIIDAELDENLMSSQLDRLIDDDEFCITGVATHKSGVKIQSLPYVHRLYWNTKNNENSRKGLMRITCPNGRIGSDNLVFDAEDRLVDGRFYFSSYSHMPQHIFAIQNGFLPRSIHALNSKNAFISYAKNVNLGDQIISPLFNGESSEIYGHLIIDYIPRILELYLSSKGGILFLADRKLKKYEMEIFDVLGITPKILVMEPDTLYKAKTVVSATVGGPVLANFPALRKMISRINEQYPRSSLPVTKRIYVSRRLQPDRVICTEGELESVVKDRGFDVIYPEKLTVHEQIDLFRSAKYTVSSFGSQLHGNMFLAGGLKYVLEILTKAPAENTAAMHSFLGHRYIQIFAELNAGEKKFYIDPKKFAESLDQLLEVGEKRQ